MAAAPREHLHVALARDWEAAREGGTYPIPPGPGGAPAPFIHLCFPEQLPGVLERFFARVPDPLVVLAVDPSGLDVRLEEAAGGEGRFPHLYGPLPVGAVRAVRPDPR